MKKLRQIITEIQSLDQDTDARFIPLLWQYICYPPKIPVRLQQQQLLDEAEPATLKANDGYFAKKDLLFNAFKWGTGKRKVILTHGWGSKAADFSEMIIALRQIDDLEVIAFDVPGNGSSEGDLSHLLLFVEAVKAIVRHYGKPGVMIGHSFGAMANIVAAAELQYTPRLFISLTPLIRLKENFEQSMNAISISKPNQDNFFKRFEEKFGMKASTITLNNKYNFEKEPNHWIAFDKNDHVSPYEYLEQFLKQHSSIIVDNYEDEGHFKIFKSERVIKDIVDKVKMAIE